MKLQFQHYWRERAFLRLCAITGELHVENSPSCLHFYKISTFNLIALLYVHMVYANAFTEKRLKCQPCCSIRHLNVLPKIPTPCVKVTDPRAPDCYCGPSLAPLTVRGKSVPVTGRGGSRCCEISKLQHGLDNRHTDGDKVSLTRRSRFTYRKIPGTHFC
jgi:hypothetical protein